MLFQEPVQLSNEQAASIENLLNKKQAKKFRSSKTIS